jgi:hypothetical protein
MTPAERKRAYALVKSQASLQEAGSLNRDRSILLLWYLRNVLGLDDLVAYDYVCDGSNDEGVDGLYLEPRQDEDDADTLVVYQSHYTQAPKDIGPNKLQRLVSIAAHFKDAVSMNDLLNDPKVEPALKRLITTFELVPKLQDGQLATGRLRVRLVLITTGVLNADAARLVKSVNKAEGQGYLTVYDLPRVAKIAEVVAAPASGVTTIDVAVPASDRLVITETPHNRVMMAAVPAIDIVGWDGLESRKLFALNVRSELKKNRVRDRIDAAIRRADEHRDFLASHNGMTVTCDHFDDADAQVVTLHEPSVVNGAQSAIAFARGNADGELTNDLRVFVKFVEVAGRPHFASTVSERSNTQNAVNPRNLVANSGPQRRLEREFNKDFPKVLYITKPDATLDAAHKGPVIHNDEAAQYLCTIFNQEPWLAVKKNALFESDNYPNIFREDIHATHIVLCQAIADHIDAHKDRFPPRYRKSWKLTRLVACYLMTQVLRADDDLVDILDDPEESLKSRAELAQRLKLPLGAAAVTLKKRRDKHERDDQDDDYTAEFKNTEYLKGLRDKARDEYITLREYSEIEDQPDDS